MTTTTHRLTPQPHTPEATAAINGVRADALCRWLETSPSAPVLELLDIYGYADVARSPDTHHFARFPGLFLVLVQYLHEVNDVVDSDPADVDVLTGFLRHCA